MKLKKIFGLIILSLCGIAFADFAWKFGGEVAAKVITTAVLFAIGIILLGSIEKKTEFNPPP